LSEVKALEEKALTEGVKVPIAKGVDYYIYDAKEVIGASRGEESTYLRIELTSDGSFHGHPLTKAEYNKYSKKVTQSQSQ